MFQKSFYLLIVFLQYNFHIIYCDKIVSLEDIERDNTDSVLKDNNNNGITPKTTDTEETKYFINQEINQHQYHKPTKSPEEQSNQLKNYNELQPYKQSKYTVIKLILYFKLY